jgi:IS1 family transposase
MNRLDSKERAQIIRALVEGNSIRSTVRITGFAKNTVTKLLVELGAACAAYQDEHLRDLTSVRVEADEIWTFVHAKAKNLPEEKRDVPGFGDVWTWTALDPDSKLMCSWLVADRSMESAQEFMADLAPRFRNRIQVTTDGHAVYADAVESAFAAIGAGVDHAMLIKQYGVDDNGAESPTARRYSPNKVTSEQVHIVTGDPNLSLVSTSFVERSNLTMRMGSRRFTRLTNGFSKKVENLAAAVALHFMYYNFARPHKTLGRGITPAMAAGIADHCWSVEDIAKLLEK